MKPIAIKCSMGIVTVGTYNQILWKIYPRLGWPSYYKKIVLAKRCKNVIYLI